jgi:hypothetical protein
LDLKIHIRNKKGWTCVEVTCKHIMINQCTKVDARSKGNTIMAICASVERTWWRTVVGSSGCGHEKVETH